MDWDYWYFSRQSWFQLKNGQNRDFPSGPVVKNPPCNAENTGLISDPGKSHTPSFHTCCLCGFSSKTMTIYNKGPFLPEYHKTANSSDKCVCFPSILTHRWQCDTTPADTSMRWQSYYSSAKAASAPHPKLQDQPPTALQRQRKVPWISFSLSGAHRLTDHNIISHLLSLWLFF